jgi:adenine/guanine phosphoribosyltransferase-like PRPP-binding protein
MQDYAARYREQFYKKSAEYKLDRIRCLVREGLPPAMALGLIILITRK